MEDSCGRKIDYLRISVINRCNLRCAYCVPEGFEPPRMPMLSEDELLTCIKAAAGLGIHTIRLTGGEPLLRKDIVSLVGKIKKTEGISKVSLTTNGVLLGDMAEDLRGAGLTGVNVSLDTLVREHYRRLTGRDAMEKVLSSIDTALSCGLKVKINTVLLAEYPEDFWELLLLAREKNIDVRLIERMPFLGQKRESRDILKLLLDRFPKAERVEGDSKGPAEYLKIPGFLGRVGFILPLQRKFCERCNRIRLTSDGVLKGCLCASGGVSILSALREGKPAEVEESMRRVIMEKPKQHVLEHRGVQERRPMILIGG